MRNVDKQEKEHLMKAWSMLIRVKKTLITLNGSCKRGSKGFLDKNCLEERKNKEKITYLLMYQELGMMMIKNNKRILG